MTAFVDSDAFFSDPEGEDESDIIFIDFAGELRAATGTAREPNNWREE